MRQTSKFIYTSFCILLLICTISQAQVKIKERVEIEPPILNLQKNSNDIISASHTVRFEIDWDMPNYEAFIFWENHLSSHNTGWTKGGSLSLTLDDVTPGNFMFQYRLNTPWYEPVVTNYRIFVDGDLVKSGSHTLTAYSIHYGMARVPYYLEKGEIEVLEPASGAKEIINILPEIPTTIVKARLKSYFKGNVDYNFELEVQWKKTNVNPNETVTEYLEGNITAQNESVAEWTIPWEGKFTEGYSNSTKLTVTAVADGETYTKEVLNPYKILADEAFNKYIIHTRPSGIVPIYGDEPEDLFASTYKGVSGSGTPFEYLPAETKYNLVITEGQEHGVIGYKANGNTVSETGLELYNLDHYSGSGRLYFEYKPYKKVLSKENVTIKVSTTDPDIEPVDMNLVLTPNPLLARAVPNVIQPGDTCKIILQVYNEAAGKYIDFAEDHEFFVDLSDGWWYGDLYSYYEDDVDYWWWDIPGPFDFIAFEDIFTGEDANKDEVTVLVYVETYIVYDDDGNPLPNIVVSGDKFSSRPNKLPRKEMEKLRKQFGGKRKKEMQQNNVKDKGSVDYEKDNVTIKQLDYGSAPIETTSSTTVFTYFEIIISNKNKEVYYVKADFEKDTFSPGDTVNVIMKKLDAKGIEYDFDSETLFEVGVEYGCKAVYILDENGDRQDYVQSMKGPIRIIIAEDITDDSPIELRVGAHDDDENTYKPYSDYLLLQSQGPNASQLKKSNKRTVNLENPGYCVPPEFNQFGHGIAIGLIEIPLEIMLGETKYLGLRVIVDGEGNVIRYKIEEIEEREIPFVNKPIFPEDKKFVKSKDIWSLRPIDIEEKGKSPIYYDWFWPTIYTSGTDRPTANPLPDGMIRIIGRYWQNENLVSKYGNSVNIFTNFAHCTLEVKVIKPNKLGHGDAIVIEGPTESGDVIDYNLDELMIEWAGSLGIAPQILKGIAENESNLELAYRYEPFDDITRIQNNKHYSNGHIYWINSQTDLGTPGIPDHDNVYYADGEERPYPGYITVWDFYEQHYSFYFPEFYNSQQDKWDEYYKKNRKILKKQNVDEAVLNTQAEALAYVDWNYFLEKEIGGTGMKGVIAQTRIAASYGPMQLTYYYKFKAPLEEYNYPDNDPEALPEYINIPSVNVEWASKHLLGKIRDVLNTIPYKETDTWPKNAFYDLIYWKGLNGYNGKETYPNKVFNKSKDLYPKK